MVLIGGMRGKPLLLLRLLLLLLLLDAVVPSVVLLGGIGDVLGAAGSKDGDVVLGMLDGSRVASVQVAYA